MGKKYSVAQVAKQAGVSPATVSRVFNHPEQVKEETIRQVQDAIAALGYEAPAFKTIEHKKQRVIILTLYGINNIFYTEILEGANASAKAHGCHLMISMTALDQGTIGDFCNLIQTVDAAGVIILQQASAPILRTISNLTKVVQCCEYNSEVNLPYVTIDDYNAGKKATEYLISRGRNKIALFNGPLICKYARERRRGFLDAVNNAGITIPPNWLVQFPEISYDMAHAAAVRLLTEEVKPDAFFAVSDTYAAAIIRAAKVCHYDVPKDIFVLGFDNIEITSMQTPTISTVAQPKFQQGYTACEMLIECIENPNANPKPVVFETELLIRESTMA